MVEILYRLYEVRESAPMEKDILDTYDFGGLWSMSQEFSYELCMDCWLGESRDAFKDYIRDIYGKDIKFAYSKKYKVGQQYCIIIGEHCYNAENYFNRITYNCAECGLTVTGWFDKCIKIPDYVIRTDLNGDFDSYGNLKFCCNKCYDRWMDKEKLKLHNDTFSSEFIYKESFKDTGVAGYIYKISKKSTQEFYVGQTMYLPIFRWGQHLKSDRFPADKLTDYVFEVLEIVPNGANILEREDHWIHHFYNENPEKSLNIQNLQKDRRLAEERKKFKMKIGETPIELDKNSDS